MSTVGCTRVFHSQMLQGLPMTSGRYLTAYYQSPDFKPDQESYHLEEYPLGQVTGVDRSLAEKLFQEELVAAIQKNGLALQEQEAKCTLVSQVLELYLRGPGLRFISGKSHAALSVAGVIRRGSEVVFAYQDRVQVTCPINPRHPTSMESELMVRQVMRRFASDLLNEMLLPQFAPPTDSTLPPPPTSQGFMAEGG